MRTGKGIERSCPRGTNLLKVLNTLGRPLIDSPCGGKGTCGKCKVTVVSGEVPPPHGTELRLLDPEELEKGIRLACTITVAGDMVISLPDETGGAHIQTEGSRIDVELDPLSRKEVVKLPEPTLEDQRDDSVRLLDSLAPDKRHLTLPVMRLLPERMRADGFEVTVTRIGGEIVAVEPGDTRQRHYGFAVDIGTTTVVAYLVDLSRGIRLDAASGLNEQKAHGLDVISRIQYTTENRHGLETLRREIIGQMNALFHDLAERNGIGLDSVSCTVLAGNTTMLHLAAGIPPAKIAVVPFTPVFTDPLLLTADEMGIEASGAVRLLPGVSGYVGSDIVAAIIASGINAAEELSLLIDIGTNGEIVLGNSTGLACCSTAAGPAFEGAHIRDGIGGILGAINTITLVNGTLEYTTIGDHRPIGICGSGIVDALAMLLEAGVVDETGRLSGLEDIRKTAPALAERYAEIDGEPAIRIAGEAGAAIHISQRDIREIQLAKASIAAGIRTLAATTGHAIGDITKVYLAGGFGSFIDQANAVRIGLIPAELADRITVIGNAAGTGAVMSLMSRKYDEICGVIAKETRYLELSSSPEFQNFYVDNMFFP